MQNARAYKENGAFNSKNEVKGANKTRYKGKLRPSKNFGSSNIAKFPRPTRPLIRT